MAESNIPSSKEIRRTILEIALSGQTVHIPSAFSIVELVKILHQRFLKYPENNARSEARDYLVLSKGHGVMALYPIIMARGWVQQSDLDDYFKDGSRLPGLCEAVIPGCEANTGSLGQGVGVAVGLALAAKLRRSDQFSVCITGDGELNEGSAFESLSFAGHHRLGNFICIVDLNGFQAMGETSSVIAQDRLDLLFEALGFEVLAINGHDENAIEQALAVVRNTVRTKPLAILAETVKGKGLSFMEKDNTWHYKRLDEASFRAAITELESHS